MSPAPARVVPVAWKNVYKFVVASSVLLVVFPVYVYFVSRQTGSGELWESVAVGHGGLQPGRAGLDRPLYPFEDECWKNVRTYKGPGRGRSARSEEVYIPEVEGLLTTNVCYFQGHFFRAQGDPGHVSGPVLKQHRFFDEQFGENPRFSGWRSVGAVLEVKVPLNASRTTDDSDQPLPHRRGARKQATLSLVAGCPTEGAVHREEVFRPTRFLKRLKVGAVPGGAAAARWLGREAVTLLGIERVYTNIAHWGRDMVFFHRAAQLLRYPGGGTAPNYLLTLGEPEDFCYAGNMLSIATRGLTRLTMPGLKQGEWQPEHADPRPVCMRAVLQRTKQYPGDAPTHESFADAARKQCGVTSGAGEGGRVRMTVVVRKRTRAFRKLPATVDFFARFAAKHDVALQVVDLSDMEASVEVQRSCKRRGACAAFCGQVQLMARTDVLVGLHGAGLSNAMFLRPASLLLELANCSDVSDPAGFISNGHYSELARAHNLYYLGFGACAVVGAPQKCACLDAAMHSPLCSTVLDLAKLERTLELAVAVQRAGAAAARGPAASPRAPAPHPLTRRDLEEWLTQASSTIWNVEDVVERAGVQINGILSHNEESFCADKSADAAALRRSSGCCNKYYTMQKVILDRQLALGKVTNPFEQTWKFDTNLRTIYAKYPAIKLTVERLAPCNTT